MDYHQGTPHPERQAHCDEVLRAVKQNGSWIELNDDQLAEFVVEVERFSFLPIVEQSWMITALSQDPFTLGLFVWHVRMSDGAYARAEGTLNVLLHIRPTADAGHLILRPETMSDKINELFKRVDLDFPGDRVFSRRHYVLAEESSSAEQLLTPEVRRCLNALPHVSLESRGGDTLLAPLGVAHPEQIEPILQAGRAIAGTA